MAEVAPLTASTDDDNDPEFNHDDYESYEGLEDYYPDYDYDYDYDYEEEYED